MAEFLHHASGGDSCMDGFKDTTQSMRGDHGSSYSNGSDDELFSIFKLLVVRCSDAIVGTSWKFGVDRFQLLTQRDKSLKRDEKSMFEIVWVSNLLESKLQCGTCQLVNSGHSDKWLVKELCSNAEAASINKSISMLQSHRTPCFVCVDIVWSPLQRMSLAKF